ncbi:MAG: AbrB/MazE/SpoVT family DNA-binding domain-containing protein [Planctomycetota bacterium]
MAERIIVNDRGVVTIPAALRRAFGLKAGGELMVSPVTQNRPLAVTSKPATFEPLRP